MIRVRRLISTEAATKHTITLNPSHASSNTIKWVPFRLKEKEAIDRFAQFHRIGSLFGPTAKHLTIQRTRKLLIPNYFYDIQVRTIIEAIINDEIRVHSLLHRYTPDNCLATRIGATHAFPATLINGLRRHSTGDLRWSEFEDMPTGAANDGENAVVEAMPFSIPDHVAVSSTLEPFLQSIKLIN
jgi:hypothetical protein